MRSLRPNSNNGIIQIAKQEITHPGQVTLYSKPITNLQRLDKLRNGGDPRICITRRRGGIGDVIMTTPTVRAIANKYNIKVDYGTDLYYLDGALPKVLKENPYIENVISWQKVDAQQYDTILDLTCPCVIHEKPLADPINRVDLFARHVGIRLEDHSLDLILTHEELEWAKQYLQRYNLSRYKLILVQPSSSNTARDAPPEKMAEALKLVMADRNIRAIVLTHNSDNTKDNRWNFSNIHIAHNLDTRQIAAIMSYTKLVLCPDSSILHVAAALHHPTVTLFGPTDPRARVNYHPEAVAVWPAGKYNTYPVWYENPKDGYLCWKILDAALIAESMKAILYDTALPQTTDLVTFGNLQSGICESL